MIHFVNHLSMSNALTIPLSLLLPSPTLAILRQEPVNLASLPPEFIWFWLSSP